MFVFTSGAVRIDSALFGFSKVKFIQLPKPILVEARNYSF
jgi:hypothetical protein